MSTWSFLSPKCFFHELNAQNSNGNEGNTWIYIWIFFCIFTFDVWHKKNSHTNILHSTLNANRNTHKSEKKHSQFTLDTVSEAHIYLSMCSFLASQTSSFVHSFICFIKWASEWATYSSVSYYDYTFFFLTIFKVQLHKL